jgi:outer membrane protein
MRSSLLAGFALASVLSAPGLAQAAAPATLTQALVDAYYNNATLQAQRASLRATDEDVPSALSGWRPTAEYTDSFGHVTGTTTQLTTSTNPFTGVSSPVTTKLGETRNEALQQIQITQPIYNGGKTVAQTRQGKNSVYAARAQLIAAEQQVFLNVVSAYVTVISDRQQLALDQGDAEVLRQQLKDTEEQFQIGEITYTSVAQAQASLAQAKEQVEVAAGNLDIARENFRELVGDYPADVLEPPQPLLLPYTAKEQVADAATANNPNVIAAQYTDAASKDAVDVAFAALMPQLSVTASAYTESGPSGPHTNANGGQVLGQLTVPIFQGGAEYSAIRAARAHEQQTFASILDAQRTAYQTATQSWIALISSRAAIVSTNAEIKANAIALDGTEREELAGTRTTLDVLNAQEALLNSQVQQVQNIATLVTNSYTVASAVGRLTASDLGLPVQQYDDLKYYKSVKYAGFGTGESADKKAGLAANGFYDGSVPPAPDVTPDPAANPALVVTPTP